MPVHIDAAASDSRKRLLVEKYLTEEWFVDACADADPTPNGQYTEWLVKTFKHLIPSKTDEEFTELFEDLTEVLTEYGRLKNNPQWVRTTTTQRGKDAGNILTYSYEELVGILGAATRENLSKKEQQRELRRKRQKYLDEGADQLGVEGEYVVFQANTGEAASLMAEGTHWCTKSESTARNYIQRGSLYILMEDTDEGDLVPRLQCYIPNDISRFEFEDEEGRDLYRQTYNEKAIKVDPQHWSVIEFLISHNARLRRYLDQHLIYTDGMEEPEFRTCSWCGDMEDDEAFIVVDDPDTGDTTELCSTSCFRAHFEDYISSEVDSRLVYDGTQSENAKAQLDNILYRGGGSEAAKRVIDMMIESAKRLNLPNKTIPTLGEWEYSPNWYLDNAKTSVRYLESGEPQRLASVEKILPGITVEDLKTMIEEVAPLAEKSTGRDQYVREAIKQVAEEFEPDSMDVGRILEALGYTVKQPKVSHVLLKKAKAINIPNEFTNVMTDLILEIFEKAYRGKDSSMKLKDAVRRDTSWEIERSDWEAKGGDFKRSGDLPLDGLVVVMETDPDKAVAPGHPSPVIYSAAVNIEPDHRWATLVLTLNGNLTIESAVEQLRQHDQNIRMILKHEFAHLYDRQLVEEKKNTDRFEEDEDDFTYFNRPHEVRAWITTLLEEFDQYVSKQKGELGNELINSFLKGSRGWSLLSQNLNAQNRRVALRELSRKLETLKGERHGHGKQ